MYPSETIRPVFGYIFITAELEHAARSYVSLHVCSPPLPTPLPAHHHTSWFLTFSRPLPSPILPHSPSILSPHLPFAYFHRVGQHWNRLLSSLSLPPSTSTSTSLSPSPLPPPLPLSPPSSLLLSYIYQGIILNGCIALVYSHAKWYLGVDIP